MNFYFQVFFESFHHATVVPFGGEATLYAMKAFGTFAMETPFVLAVIGATLGQLFNWYVGRILLYYQHKGKFRVTPHHYERARALFNTYGVFLLLFSWAMLMNLLVVLTGFLNIPLKKCLPLLFAGIALHYGLDLLL